MERREFLKQAGIGSTALASLSMVGGAASAHQLFGRHYTFVVFSQAETVDGVAHTIGIEGRGSFSAGTNSVGGGGNFVHFDFAAEGVPKPIIGSGRWEARRFMSLSQHQGTYGRLQSAILTMRVRLFPDEKHLDSTSAIMQVVCNLGPAGLATTKHEGVYLEIPDAPFGKFKPFEPALGLTILSTQH
jgi:hypothetical protein